MNHAGSRAGALTVAVVGATGLVGREIVACLAERQFPVGQLVLYASDRSAGEKVDFGERSITVQRLPRELPTIDVAFLAGPAEVSRRVAEELVGADALVIDLSPFSRSQPGVAMTTIGWRAPIRSPEEGGRGMLLALPSALGLLIALPLHPIAALSPIRRVVATALVSASALGRRGLEELSSETVALLNAQESESEGRAFNCIAERRGDEGAERSLGAEAERDVRRLLGIDVPVAVAAVQTPTFHSHGVSLSVETESPIAPQALRQALRTAPSIVLEEEPTNTRDAVGSEAIHVGGLRFDPDPRWVHFWAAGDNLRQGGALAAVAVAEAVAETRTLS